MRVSTGALAVIVLPCPVFFQAPQRPIVQRVAQALAASTPHQHEPSLSALPCDWRTSCIATQSVIISFCKRLASLGKHSGAHGLSDSRQGEQYGGVTMLLCCPVATRAGAQFLQHTLDPFADLLVLLMHATQ